MTESFLLTDVERNRFASYLERDAHSSRMIIEQMKKLGPHGIILAENEEMYASAAELIARKLRSVESMSIEG